MIPVNELIRGYNLFKDEYEAKAIEVLRSGWYVLGKEVDSFEKEFAHDLGENCYCAGVDNGLNAIRLGLEAAGIHEGDEIIVQANGYIATMLGIIQAGGKPVFVEPDEYYELDAAKIEDAITDKTKGVCLTHLYGQCTRMDKILEICKKHNLKLFEDCAQSHFASYKGTNSGLFGDVGFFSFYPTKNLGGFGDGGCVVSRNKAVIDKVKVLRNYGSDIRYHNIEIGYNSRLDELQAGLLRVKLRHMPELIANRKHIAERYLNEMKNDKVRLPKVAEGCDHIWYQFIVQVDDQSGFRDFLKENGVSTDISWKVPPFLQPCIMDKYGYHEGMFPLTEKICNAIVTLPMMDVMSEDEIDKVIDAVNKY